jgi:Secretion system C-terminal sorting domain
MNIKNIFLGSLMLICVAQITDAQPYQIVSAFPVQTGQNALTQLSSTSIKLINLATNTAVGNVNWYVSNVNIGTGVTATSLQSINGLGGLSAVPTIINGGQISAKAYLYNPGTNMTLTGDCSGWGIVRIHAILTSYPTIIVATKDFVILPRGFCDPYNIYSTSWGAAGIGFQTKFSTQPATNFNTKVNQTGGLLVTALPTGTFASLFHTPYLTQNAGLPGSINRGYTWTAADADNSANTISLAPTTTISCTVPYPNTRAMSRDIRLRATADWDNLNDGDPSNLAKNLYSETILQRFPAITANSTDLCNNAVTNLVLTCELASPYQNVLMPAAGMFKYSYEWRHNGITVFGGPTNYSARIATISNAQPGNYTCIVREYLATTVWLPTSNLSRTSNTIAITSSAPPTPYFTTETRTRSNQSFNTGSCTIPLNTSYKYCDVSNNQSCAANCAVPFVVGYPATPTIIGRTSTKFDFAGLNGNATTWTAVLRILISDGAGGWVAPTGYAADNFSNVAPPGILNLNQLNVDANGDPYFFNNPPQANAQFKLKVDLTNACGAITSYEKIFQFNSTNLLKELDELAIDKNEIKVYPNPTSNSVTIELDSDDNSLSTLVITSMDGKVILKETNSSNNRQNSTKFVVNTSEFLPGIYQYMVINGENTFRGKLTKQN